MATGFLKALPAAWFFLTLCVWAAALAVRLKKDIVLTLPFAGMLIVLLGYLLALLNILRVFPVIAVIISIVCGIYLILHQYRSPDKISFRRYVITHGLLILSVWFVISLVINIGREIVAWDDFSFWAISIKEMVRLDHLYTFPDAAITICRWCPPAYQLVGYLSSKLAGGFSEPVLFISAQTFCMLFVAPAFVLLRRKTSRNVLMCLMCVFPLSAYLLPSFDPISFLNSLYADTAVGVIYGFALILLLFDDLRNRYGKLYLPTLFLSGFLLCALKQIGIVFVVALIGAVAIKELVSQRGLRKRGILAPIFMVCAGGWFSLVSWSWHLKRFPHILDGARGIQEMPFIDLARLLFGQGSQVQYQIVRNYVRSLLLDSALAYLPFSFAFSCCLWIMALVVFCRLRKKQEEPPQTTRGIIAGVMFGVIINLAGLLLAYLFSFSNTEALGLVCISRYLSPLMISLAMVGLVVLLDRYRLMKVRTPATRSALFRIVVMCLVVLLTFLPVFLYVRTNYRVHYRRHYCREYPRGVSMDVSGKKVFIVAQGDEGLLYFRTSYYLSPVFLNPYATWSVSEECKTMDDPVTPRITYSEWVESLRQGKYDYVYLMKIDKDFAADYGVLFKNPASIVADQYYRVKIIEDKVRLEAVKP